MNPVAHQSACTKWGSLYIVLHIHTTHWIKLPNIIVLSGFRGNRKFSFLFCFMVFKILLIFNCLLNYSHAKAFSCCCHLKSKCPARLLQGVFLYYVCIQILIIQKMLTFFIITVLQSLPPGSFLIFIYSLSCSTDIIYTVGETNTLKGFFFHLELGQRRKLLL